MLRKINKSDLKRVSIKYVKCGKCGLRSGDFYSEDFLLGVLKTHRWLYNPEHVEIYCFKCLDKYIRDVEEC